MKVIKTKEGLRISVNNSYFKNTSFDDKKAVEKVLKELILKIEKWYKVNFKGFYKVKIYPNMYITFIEFIKIDDEIYDVVDVDFRVIIIYNKDIYFKYEDFSLINSDNVFFYDNNYYINIKYLTNYIKYADMGELVFFDDFDKITYIKKED